MGISMILVGIPVALLTIGGLIYLFLVLFGVIGKEK